MWPKGAAGRNILTVAGDVRLVRLYLVCPRRGHSRHPLDERLGVAGFVSPHARKLLSLAGASWSFAAAAGHLAEFCGVRTCNRTIRTVCYEEAGLLAGWPHDGPAAGAGFAAAAGDVEFQTDGTMVNTWEGWREMRLGVFAKRQRGRPAAADEWDTRRPPPPHARVLFGGVETAEHFGPRIRRRATRLGIRDPAEVSVLGDGAEWIWNQAAVQLPGSRGFLDIYHGSEHLSGCAKALYGEGAAEGRARVEAGRRALLTEGWAGLRSHLAAGTPDGCAFAREAAGAGRRGAVLRAAGGVPRLRAEAAWRWASRSAVVWWRGRASRRSAVG